MLPCVIQLLYNNRVNQELWQAFRAWGGMKYFSPFRWQLCHWAGPGLLAHMEECGTPNFQIFHLQPYWWFTLKVVFTVSYCCCSDRLTFSRCCPRQTITGDIVNWISFLFKNFKNYFLRSRLDSVNTGLSGRTNVLSVKSCRLLQFNYFCQLTCHFAKLLLSKKKQIFPLWLPQERSGTE